MKAKKYSSFYIILALLALVRLIAMWCIPLGEGTEARYAEMAREMLVTNDWITVWYKTGIPFWGKPPMTIWLCALSMKTFGVNAFAARLPDFILLVAVLVLLYHFLKYYRDEKIARVGVLVLASSVLFFILAGAVLMDPALLFAIFLCQISFFDALERGKKLAGYLFFLGLAIGLLVKGLVIVVLVGGSTFLWVLWQRKWRDLFTKLSIITGTLGMLILVLPWYILAELKTPGFLNYFILGEHFSRFMHTAWQGDKYGSAHAQFFGMIWLYFLTATLPWSLFLISIFRQILCQSSTFFCKSRALFCHSRVGGNPSMYKTRMDSRLRGNDRKECWTDSYFSYWLLCLSFPLIFFTFARNLIFPYVAPTLPAFAILFAEFWASYYKDKPENSIFIFFSSSVAVIVTALLLLGIFYKFPPVLYYSQNKMISTWQKAKGSAENPIVYWKKSIDTSALFYAKGRVLATVNPEVVCKKVNCNKPVYFVVAEHDLPHFRTQWKIFLQPTSRGLSAGSTNLSTALDPADKPRDVGAESNKWDVGVEGKTLVKEIAELNVHPYKEYLVCLEIVS
ncbi:MAG: hypothetical protein A3F18_04260 [Legionellales bacterium RIFCSPHIGHO2_12_FULL_37_14]|nr:MAG: hypothetical protein A3F18_04260 [Legionellales bacterium RIFCSPHIGHO2_12_FULL_37_14]